VGCLEACTASGFDEVAVEEVLAVGARANWFIGQLNGHCD
jgi:hypothetical protein